MADDSTVEAAQPTDVKATAKNFVGLISLAREPSVSVVVPAYNAADVLPLCLASVLNQDYSELEVVVVNDGSTFHTRDFLSGVEDARLRVLHHQTNLGLAASLNNGVRAASGDLVMFLHADCELLSKDFIQRAAAHFADPSVAWVTGHYDHARGPNSVERIFAALRARKTRYPCLSGLVRVGFAEGKCDMIRHIVVDAAGGFPTDTKWSGEDQLLSYKLRERGFEIFKDSSLAAREHCAARSSWASLLSNLRKEFVHGKTQAWINLRHFRTVVMDVLTGRNVTSDRGRYALVKLLSGSTLLALAAACTIQPEGGPLQLLGLAAIMSTAYYFAHIQPGKTGLATVEALAGAFVASMANIIYTVGMLWGTVVIASRGGHLKEPL